MVSIPLIGVALLVVSNALLIIGWIWGVLSDTAPEATARYSIRVFWHGSDSAYVAECPELGNVSALGTTRVDAVQHIQTAMEMAVESYRARGLDVPAPGEDGE